MNKPGLLTPSVGYKPFRYPQFFKAWDTQQKIHWLPDEVPLADDVKDWNTRLTTGEKNLLTQIFRFFTQADIDVADNYVNRYLPIFKPTEVLMALTAFASSECFDRQTEILTTEGWKTCDTITDADRIAQYNIETGNITFVNPTRVVSYRHTGVMHHYKNGPTDIMVTPNHDLIVKHPSTGKVKKAKSESGKWAQNYLYPSTGRRANEEDNIPTIERLKIAVAADGCLRVNCPSVSEGNRTVDFHIKKVRKISRLNDLFSALNIRANQRQSEDGFSKYTFQFPGTDKISDLKTLDFISLQDMTPEKALAYVNEILMWDGSTTGPNDAFYSTEKKAVDKFQALCVIAGIATTLTVNYPARRDVFIQPLGKTVDQTKTCYVVTCCDRNWRTYPHREEVIFDEDVFCVSVPDQNIVTRRNGRVAITGNSVHIAAYSHLLDTIGIPEAEYLAFLQISEMRAKHDYMASFNVDSPYEIAKTLAAFGAFTEGLQLFASFAMLLNFQRFGKMRGMGQVISWSVRDESLHCETIIELFHVWCSEHPGLFDDKMKTDLANICQTIVAHEDAFIDLAFRESGGEVEGMTADEIKQYIRFIADRRLIQLGLPCIYNVRTNPLPWLDEVLNSVEHVNFFENRATEYSRAATTGDWGEIEF